MGKHDQRKHDLTLLKQGFIVAIFMMAVIFGPDLRGTIIKSQGSMSSGISERVLTLEMQNVEHATLINHLEQNTIIIGDLTEAVGILTVQVEGLAAMVSDMQDREYARLSGGS